MILSDKMPTWWVEVKWMLLTLWHNTINNRIVYFWPLVDHGWLKPWTMELDNGDYCIEMVHSLSLPKSTSFLRQFCHTSHQEISPPNDSGLALGLTLASRMRPNIVPVLSMGLKRLCFIPSFLLDPGCHQESKTELACQKMRNHKKESWIF